MKNGLAIAPRLAMPEWKAKGAQPMASAALGLPADDELNTQMPANPNGLATLAKSPRMTNAALQPTNPYKPKQAPPMMNGLRAAIDGFQRGFDPQGYGARMQAKEADQTQRHQRALSLLTQQRNLPTPEARVAWMHQNKGMLSEVMGQDLSDDFFDPNDYTDEVMDGQISALMGALGVMPEAPEYGFINAGDGAVYRTSTAGDFEQVAEGKPAPARIGAYNPNQNVYNLDTGDLIQKGETPEMTPFQRETLDIQRQRLAQAGREEDRQFSTLSPDQVAALNYPVGTIVQVDDQGAHHVRSRPSTRQASVPASVLTGESKYLDDLDESVAAAQQVARQTAEFVDRSKGYNAQGQGPLNDAMQALSWRTSDLNQITQAIAPNMRQAGSGAMSDRDVEMYMNSTVNVNNLAETNQRIARASKAVADRSKQHALFLRQWAADNPGQLNRGKLLWSRFADAFPVFDQTGAPAQYPSLPDPYSWAMSGGATGATQTPSSPSLRGKGAGVLRPEFIERSLAGMMGDDGGQQGGPEPGAVEDGYQFMGGDPADPQNWRQVQ